MMVTLAPLTAPAVAGANVTVRVADCPGVSTVPFETPLTLNPAPVAVTLEIVMFEFPLLVSVVVSGLLVPSPTLPNDKLAGLVPSDKVGVAPVPDRFITRGDGVPFVVSVMLPLTVPAEEGVKTALKFRLPPAAIVVDVERPVWLKPVPETAIWENVRVALPLFWRVIGWELLFPTVTVPKLTLVGFAEISG